MEIFFGRTVVCFLTARNCHLQELYLRAEGRGLRQTGLFYEAFSVQSIVTIQKQLFSPRYRTIQSSATEIQTRLSAKRKNSRQNPAGSFC